MKTFNDIIVGIKKWAKAKEIKRGVYMDLRVLRYFLTVAKEQSFTKAAKQLHITQPTLSRQLAAVDLEDKIASEFKGSDGIVEGTITVGCGEFMAVEIFARICKIYKEKYPMVRFAVHTGTADTVFEMMNRGLVDIGLFLEPVNTEGLDYIRIQGSDHWIVGIKPDDPLAEKEYITKEDLIDLPLILPERLTVQSELANWFGKDFNRLNIAFTSNLGTNAGVMALYGLGYPVSVEGAGRYWRSDLLVQKKLYPEIKTSTVIAWRRNIPYSTAVSKLIEEINGFKIHM